MQPHVVATFDYVDVPADLALNALVTDSVRQSTIKTYESALHTIGKFLHAHRKLLILCPFPEGCTMSREEFTLFLYSLQQQGSSSANTYRSALAWDQRRQGVELFALEKTFIKACKGTTKNIQKVFKGVITPAMLEDFLSLVRKSTKTYVPSCKCCNTFFLDNFKLTTEDPTFCDVFNLSLCHWTDFQYSARLRPGEAEVLKIQDKHSSMHLLGSAMVQCEFLFFAAPRKNDSGGPFRIDVLASAVFDKLAAGRPKESFLVPLCADKHIGDPKGERRVGLAPRCYLGCPLPPSLYFYDSDISSKCCC